MRAIWWGGLAIAFLGLWPGAAAAEQPEVLLGVSMDFDAQQITLQMVSSGCTRKEDFRFEFSNGVLTVIRKERDACKAMPRKHAYTFSLTEVGIDRHTPFRFSNTFIVNELLANVARPTP